jgi:hypothetical protein
MILKVDSSEKKFYICEYGWSSTNYVCNLKDVPKVIKDIADKEPYKIYMIWNHKLVQLSKKKMNEMFEANRIKFRF